MYIRDQTYRVLGESLGQIDVSSTSRITSPTTPSLEAMTCRLLCASNLTYAPKPRATFPYYEKGPDFYYKKAGFLDRPTVIDGRKIIDQCLIGTLNGPAPAPKSIVLAFRGTVGNWASDWLNDSEAVLVPFTRIPSVLVHKGFNDSVESFFGQGIVRIIKARLKENPGARLYITGHSKGGALAYVGALLLRTMHPDIPVAGVITFEAPRPGHPSFVKAYNDAKIDTLRYEFQNDIVPHLPPSGDFAKSLEILLAKSPVVAAALSFLYPRSVFGFTYEQVGALRFINWSGSIVEDSPGLQKERIARMSPLLLGLIALGGPIAIRLPSLHSIACGSGSWSAICKANGCP